MTKNLINSKLLNSESTNNSTFTNTNTTISTFTFKDHLLSFMEGITQYLDLEFSKKTYNF